MQTLSFLLIEVIIRLCSQQKVGPILNKKDEYSPLILSQPKHQINSFDCQIECLTCQDQLCYKCWDGWNLINDECIQICGDGLLAINSIEQCDDGNDEFGDGCYDCQIEWCSHYCIDCELTQFPKCNQCQEYFQVVGESDCQPICGDEYVVEELEDCDGWDILYFDNYQAQCDENCQITCLPGCCQCVYGYCLDEGFYISPFDESFYSCDELLDISKLYYGTKEVQNYCEQTQYCYINQLNIECIYNNSYFVFSKKFDCLSNQLSYFYDICGDGIIGLTEDCDDGNLLNDDGCSIKCQNEYIPGEDITLNLIFQKRFIDKQYVEITFSQQVKLISNDIIFEDRIQQFDLYYLDEQDTQIFLSQVSYSITPIIEISLEEFRTIKYQLEITFFEYPSIDPDLEIKFNFTNKFPLQVDIFIYYQDQQHQNPLMKTL